MERFKNNGDLTDEQKKTASKRWKEIHPSLRIVESAERVVKLENNLPENYGLRALDSFQLAAALVWCQEKPRRRLFITANEKLAEAAEKEGFKKILLT